MNQYETVESAHLAELMRQRDALQRKVALLSEIVREIPSIILNARLDQAEGKPSKYDYTRHGKALNAPEFS